MIDLCEHYKFPIRIIDTDGQELHCHPDYEFSLEADKTLVLSTEEQHWYQFVCFTQTKEEARECKKQE
jgi:hypothetical protein